MENINTNSKKVIFKLKHWEGITLFKVIEQDGFERGCGELYSGSNGWVINSKSHTTIASVIKDIYLRGFNKDEDNYVSTKEDEDKSIYSSILETFKELGSQGDTEPKFGDRVLVRDIEDTRWCERFLVHILPKEVIERFICVIDDYEKEFKEDKEYRTNKWKYMKSLKENSFKEISEDTFEVTF